MECSIMAKSVYGHQWQAYTPDWRGSSSGTGSIGSGGVLGGQYLHIGNAVWFNIYLYLGSGWSSPSGSWLFSYPVTVANTDYGNGIWMAHDLGTTYWDGMVRPYSSTYMRLSAQTSAGAGAELASTYPFTFAAYDSIRIAGQFQAATSV